MPASLIACSTARRMGGGAGESYFVFIVTPRWTAGDEVCGLARLPGDKASIGVINKIDLRANKNTLLPAIEQLSQRRDFAAIVPLSAKTGDGVDSLLTEIVRHLR